MDNKIRIRSIGSKLIYTLIACILLCVVFFTMIEYIYRNTEDAAFENLHLQTRQIKENINLQLISDRDNLSTMAGFASKLYSDGESFDLLFDSFESIGLIENIGILMPDGMLYTKAGNINLSGKLSFEEEAKKGEYISGRVKDVTNSGREIVRSSVPVIADGNTVAILYGVIELDTFKERYKEMADANDAELYILERASGDFIVDTLNDDPGNVSLLEKRKHKEGFSFSKMNDDIFRGKSGYSAFLSKATGEYFYVHYAPMAIEGWEIMLSQPEHVVFEEAYAARNIILIMYAMIIFIMITYILFIFNSERKESKLNFAASKIRKTLLGINQQSNCIGISLENIASFAKSRSSFFVDTDGEDYNYIIPSMKNMMLSDNDRKYFVKMLIAYADEHRDENRILYVADIGIGRRLQKSNPDFNSFLLSRKIKNVQFAAIADRKDHISVLAVTNAKNRFSADILLKDIAICFSMAVYNKKHLDKTETIAVTDSLTGLSNRMAYKKDVEYFDTYLPEKFSCIYIDVNELHFFNNKFGHAAGDGMLLFIAETLREVFCNSYVYRMGGDEFLVFTRDTEKEEIDRLIDVLNEKVEAMNYHISIGMDYCTKNLDTTALVNEAEKRMYESKALYYQQKEKNSFSQTDNQGVEHIVTGIRELDATLSIMSRHYYGIYCVSLKDDMAHRILMPSYFRDFSEEGECFSNTFSHYIQEFVSPDYQRAMLNFLKYDVLKRQLMEGYFPNISYVTNNGESIVLTIYALPGQENGITDTLWIFERKDIF